MLIETLFDAHITSISEQRHDGMQMTSSKGHMASSNDDCDVTISKDAHVVSLPAHMVSWHVHMFIQHPHSIININSHMSPLVRLKNE